MRNKVTSRSPARAGKKERRSVSAPTAFEGPGAPTPAEPAWRPWSIWTIAAGFFFFSFFTRVAPSVMVDDLMRDFVGGAAFVGNLSAFYYYAYTGCQLPVGMTLDRFGPRRALTTAAIVCMIGVLLFAFAATPGPAYVGRTLIGAGSAFAWIGSMKLATAWFPPHRFAQVIGMTALIGMTGATFGQSLLAPAVDAVGWRATQFATAAFAAVLVVLIVTIVRDRPRGVPAPSLRSAGMLRAVGAILAEPQNWIVGLTVAACGAILMAFAGLWCVPFLGAAYGFDRASAADATSMFFLGWAVGAPVTGWISDRTARRKGTILVGGAACFVAVLTLIYVPGLPGWAPYALLAASGFAGSSSVTGFAVVREINRPESAATAMALVNILPMAGAAMLQPFIGWLLDLQWSGVEIAGARHYAVDAYRMAFIPFVVWAVVTVAASLAIAETRGKSRY